MPCLKTKIKLAQ